MPDFSQIPWIAEHIRLYQTDPEKAHLWDSRPLGGPGLLPTLLLVTKGRKSGEARPLPLIYGKAGASYVVVASKGGMPQHPLWFRNLEAEPACELQVGAKRLRARARVAEGRDLPALPRLPEGHAAGHPRRGARPGAVAGSCAARSARRAASRPGPGAARYRFSCFGGRTTICSTLTRIGCVTA